MENNKTILDINQIAEILPHRYPFLLIDKIIDIKEGEYITAIKNVTFNEPHFTGHFPDKPVMPGVLMVEAMAQAGIILVVKTLNINSKDKLFYFATIDNVKFRKPVVPGDTLYITVKITQNRGHIWKISGEIKVGGELVSSGDFSAAAVDKDPAPK